MANHLLCITALPRDHDFVERNIGDMDIAVSRYTHQQFPALLGRLDELLAEEEEDHTIAVLTGGVLDYDDVDLSGWQVMQEVFARNHDIRTIVLSGGFLPIQSSDLLAHNTVFIHKISASFNRRNPEQPMSDATFGELRRELKECFLYGHGNHADLQQRGNVDVIPTPDGGMA